MSENPYSLSTTPSVEEAVAGSVLVFALRSFFCHPLNAAGRTTALCWASASGPALGLASAFLGPVCFCCAAWAAGGHTTNDKNDKQVSCSNNRLLISKRHKKILIIRHHRRLSGFYRAEELRALAVG